MPEPLTKINVEKVAHCKKTYLYFGLGDGGEAAKLTRGHSEPTKEAAATFDYHFQRELSVPVLINRAFFTGTTAALFGQTWHWIWAHK